MPHSSASNATDAAAVFGIYALDDTGPHSLQSFTHMLNFTTGNSSSEINGTSHRSKVKHLHIYRTEDMLTTHCYSILTELQMPSHHYNKTLTLY